MNAISLNFELALAAFAALIGYMSVLVMIQIGKLRQELRGELERVRLDAKELELRLVERIRNGDAA